MPALPVPASEPARPRRAPGSQTTLCGLVLGERVRTLAAFFGMGAGIGFGALALDAWPATQSAVTWWLSSAALVIAIVLYACGERLGTLWVHVVLLFGSGLVGLSQLAAGGPTAATVLGGFHVFVVVYAALYFSMPAALPHVVAFIVIQALSIMLVGSAGPGDPSGMAAHLYVVTGTMLGVAVVMRRLFHGQARLALRLHEQTLTDALTGLPNRTALRQQIEEAIGPAESLCLLLVDVDDFREVNAALGADVGDAVLHLLGERLLQVSGGNLLARLGTDQFAILLRDRTEALGARALRTAELVRGSVRASFEIQGLALPIDVSVGIAPGTPGVAFEDLLRQAEGAVHLAKRELSGVAAIEQVPPRSTPERLQLLAELRSVLAGGAEAAVGRMVPWFQPQIDIASGEVVGVEALARWEHPTRGLIPPDEFVPIVEQTGLVRELSRHMLAQVITTCAAWRREGFDLSVAVNISARDLADTTLPDFVDELLEQAGLAPALLTLEVTETAIMADAELAVDVLERIRARGVGVALDDFGTGWSSLAYLRQLPLTELKIDRSFVAELLAGDEAATIVGTVVMLARSLGLRVVAEGVEDVATHERLVVLDCSAAQGWHYGRPLPASELLALVRAAQAAQDRSAATPESKSTASTRSGGSGREK